MRQHLCQFSLKSVLISISAICLCLGIALQEARERERAVSALEQLGVIVQYDWQSDPETWVNECGRLRLVPHTRQGAGRLEKPRAVGCRIFQRVRSVILSNEKLLMRSGVVATTGSMRCRPSQQLPVSDSAFLQAVPALKQLRSLKRVYIESEPRFSVNESRVSVAATDAIEREIRDALPGCAVIREPTGLTTLRDYAPQLSSY